MHLVDIGGLIDIGDNNAAMGYNAKCGSNFDFKREEEERWNKKKRCTQKLPILMPSTQFRLLYFNSVIFDSDYPT